MKTRFITLVVFLASISLLIWLTGISSFDSVLAITKQNSHLTIEETTPAISQAITGSAGVIVISGNFVYLGTSRKWDGNQWVGNDGMHIFDISDSSNPVETGFYDTEGTVTDIAISGVYAYIVVSGYGLVIINISDPANPTQIGSFPEQFADVVAVHGNYAYVGRGPYLLVINIVNPSYPFEVSSTNIGIGVSDGFNDIKVVDNYVFLAGSCWWYPQLLDCLYGGVHIVDVSNPTSPIAVSFFETPGDYSNEITVLDNYVYVADSSGLYILDVTNKTWPIEIGSYDLEWPHSFHSITVRDNFAFLGVNHWVQGEGWRYDIRILDVTHLTNPIAVDFLITPGDAQNVASVGNHIYIADGNSGLTVLRWPDFSISHIEATQVIQDENNDVPFIAGKPTFVRVYVDCERGCDAISENVSLQGFGSSGELIGNVSPFGGVQLTNSENWQDHRDNLQKTLNFNLPQEWLTGTITLMAEVSNITKTKAITFTSGKKLRIYSVGIPYNPPQPPPPPGQSTTVFLPDEEIVSNGIRDLLAMYPVALEDVTYVIQPLFDEQIILPFSCEPNSSCPADTHYLRSLNDFWNRMSRTGGWVDGVPPDRLYGWVSEEAQDGLCGIADAIWANPQRRQGRVAAGIDSCGAETFAHEIGHIQNNQGLRHTPNRSNQDDSHCASVPAGPVNDYPNYDPLGSIGEWGVQITDGTFELLNPAETYDFMSYCTPEWISPFNYEKLNQGFAPVTSSLTLRTGAIPEPQFLASGIVFSPAMTVTLSPLFVVTSTVPPDPDIGGAYCLELRNSGEMLLDSRCFDLSFTNPESGEPTGAAGFSLALPYPNGTQAVVFTQNGVELTRTTASPNNPQVQVLSPNGGEIWQTGETYTITWAASDADRQTLHYAISFSPDGGTSWNPIVLNTTETHWVVDADRFPGSVNAKIRVEVSDGFNVGMDVSDATFTIEQKPPRPFILLPEEDTMILPGTPLWLQGYAYDLEDGTLDEAALHWRSNLDGDLGVGRQALVTLSQGRHVVTLTATDSDDNAAVVAVNVLVDYNKNYLPVILK